MSRAWQRLERLVAGWYGTVRNPLSGRNNVNDDGTRRLGDIVLKAGVVEVKRRKDLSFARAWETRRLADAHKQPWAHYEFKTGLTGMVSITVDFKTAAYLSREIRFLWDQLPQTSMSKKKMSKRVSLP